MTEQEKADRLLELEAGIIEQNHGSFYHVNGRYYANPDDAARHRRWEAEKRLRHEERLEGICGWCDRVFDADDERVSAADRFIHRKPCADEFNKLCTDMGGLELPPDELRAVAAWSNGPTDAEIDVVFSRFEGAA